MEYVASLSYGKDSLAMLHVIRDVLAWPLDRIITVDTWATDTLLADWPDVVCFKASHHAGHSGRTLREIEERFTLDDRGALPKGHRFHWARMASYGAQMTMEGLDFETVAHHLPGS